jgi:hypothetical protein
VTGAGPNVKLRGRIDTVIRVLAPALDLLLAVGDRISRIIEPEDPGYVPARMKYEGKSAPRGLRPRPGNQSRG